MFQLERLAQQQVVEQIDLSDRQVVRGSSVAILHTLMSKGEMNVGQIVTATDQQVANVSKHLKQLADAGLLTRCKEGSYVRYHLNDPVVEKICELVCDSLRQEIESQLKRSRRILDQNQRR